VCSFTNKFYKIQLGHSPACIELLNQPNFLGEFLFTGKSNKTCNSGQCFSYVSHIKPATFAGHYVYIVHRCGGNGYLAHMAAERFQAAGGRGR